MRERSNKKTEGSGPGCATRERRRKLFCYCFCCIFFLFLSLFFSFLSLFLSFSFFSSFLFANTIFLSLFIVDDNTNAPPSTSESPNTEVGNL